jgi:hypothetical protein
MQASYRLNEFIKKTNVILSTAPSMLHTIDQLLSSTSDGFLGMLVNGVGCWNEGSQVTKTSSVPEYFLQIYWDKLFWSEYPINIITS